MRSSTWNWRSGSNARRTRRPIGSGFRKRKSSWSTCSLVEGRRWVRAALESVDENTPPDLVARLEHAEADGAQQFGERKTSLAAAERALVRYRELGDVLGSA